MKRWLGMNTAQRRNCQRRKESCNGFVRFDHKHFNQLVRERIVFRLDIFHAAIVAIDQFRFWKTENNHSIFQPARAQNLRKLRRHSQFVDEGFVDGRFGFGVLARRRHIAVDDSLRFQICHALSRADDR